MFTRADIKPLSIAAATAVCAGLGFGAWAGPPAHLREPVYSGELQPIYGDDPNLARYKQVIAEQGGAGPLYIVTGYPSSAPAPAPAIAQDHADLEAEIAREAAAFEAQSRAWEAERVAWLQTFDARRAQAAQDARTSIPVAAPSAAPVAYVQPEQVTTVEEPAPETSSSPD